MTWAYLQTMAALAAVVALIYVAAHLLKKRQLGVGRRMRIEEYLAMGPKKGIAAVRVGEEVLIIGVTPTDLRLLKTVPGADFAPDAGGRTPIDAGGRTPAGSFSDALRIETAGGSASTLTRSSALSEAPK